jgi:hypothetical protein
MSATFPVRSICFCTGWSPLENMSGLQSDPLVVGGTASRPLSCADVLSPGFSSLSLSSTHHQNVSLDEVKSVWDFPGVEKLGSSGGVMSWKCCWCHSTFKGWNATIVMIHESKFSKTSGQSDIKVCTGKIPKEILELFQTYWNRASGMSSVKRQHSEALLDSIANDQISIAVAFDIKRKCSSHTGGTATNP